MSEYVQIDVRWPRDVATAVSQFAGGSEFVWLDTSSAVSARASTSAVSVIAVDPIAILLQGAAEPRGGRPHHPGSLSSPLFAGDATFRTGERVIGRDASCWRLWRAMHDRLRTDAAGARGVAPGWFGFVGFEAAGLLERLPKPRPTPLGLPIVRFGLYDAVVVLDHEHKRATLAAAPELASKIGARPLRVKPLVERWNAAAELGGGRATRLVPPRISAALTPEECLQRVRRVLDYIAAGDVYQANFAHRLDLYGFGDPLTRYAQLRRENPAPYAALLRWGDSAIASVSPELFLRVRGRDVLTRPIKGTRPRSGDAALDAAYRRQLLASEKEAAELAMIVDLHRNDLGRVCEYGSIRVPRPRVLEAHPTVYHSVADVVGRLRPDCDALDLLMAAFPAGSITGAPKIRSIEIIHELESSARGAYSGAIGYLGLNGDMTVNVAIRSLQIRDDAATLYVGGGIVADSDPQDEFDETLAKARGILAALGVTDRELIGGPRGT